MFLVSLSLYSLLHMLFVVFIQLPQFCMNCLGCEFWGFPQQWNFRECSDCGLLDMTPHSLLPRRSQYLPRSWSVKPNMGESSCGLLMGNVEAVQLMKFTSPWIPYKPLNKVTTNFSYEKTGRFFFSQNNTIITKICTWWIRNYIYIYICSMEIVGPSM
jgi:hypothetical protein